MNEFERFTKRGADRRQRQRASRERDCQRRLDEWNGQAGASLPPMLASREAAVAAASDSNAAIRRVAIDVLHNHWNATKDRDFTDVCLQMALDDHDNSVRNISILTVGNCFEGTDDVQIGLLLARILKDENELEVIRLAAYHSLLMLRCELLKKHPPRLLKMDDVDWLYVDSFLVENRTPSPVDPLAASLPDRSRSQIQAIRLYRQGTEAYSRGDYEHSIAFFTEALSHYPDARGAFGERGRAYYATGKLDHAIADFTRIIELSPNWPDGYRVRAKVYRAAGRIDLAEADEEKARELSKKEG